MNLQCTVVQSLETFASSTTTADGRSVDLVGIHFPGLDGNMHAVAMPIAGSKELQVNLRIIDDAIVGYKSAGKPKRKKS